MCCKKNSLKKCLTLTKEQSILSLLIMCMHRNTVFSNDKPAPINIFILTIDVHDDERTENYHLTAVPLSATALFFYHLVLVLQPAALLFWYSTKQQTDKLAGEHSGAFSRLRARHFSQELVEIKAELRGESPLDLHSPGGLKHASKWMAMFPCVSWIYK